MTLIIQNCRFFDHLHRVFQETPEWDLENKYKPEMVNLYFKNEKSEKFYLVDVEDTLGNVLKKKE